jgi:hypothetical protein
MADLHVHARALAHRDGLVHRVEHAAGLVPDVGGIGGVVPAQHVAERPHLLRRGERPGWGEQAR